MSMFFIVDGNLIGFGQYILSESIRPIKIEEYGVNLSLNDKKWFDISGNIVTYAKIDKLFYMIVIKNDGEVMFGVSDELDTSSLDDLSYVDSIFNDNRIGTKSVLKVFGNIIYILLQGCMRYDISYIFFSGVDKRLSEVYRRMVNNKYLIDDIKGYGFEYTGYDGGNYSFKRR